MRQVNLTTFNSRLVLEMPSVSSAAEFSEWEQQSGDGSWIPLSSDVADAVQDFYVHGLQIYSSVVRPRPGLEIDLDQLEIRESSRRQVEKFYHLAPDGTQCFYSAAENSRIVAARSSGATCLQMEDVRLPDGGTMRFELRFGAGATSTKLTVPPSSGMVQVNVDTENTRIVDCAAAEAVDDVCITPFRRRTAGDCSAEEVIDAADQTLHHGWEQQSGDGSWIPLSSDVADAVQDFYVHGLQIYSSVVRPRPGLEIDLDQLEIRESSRRQVEKFYHMAPDGTQCFYSAAENSRIVAARSSGATCLQMEDVRLPDGGTMRFELRFGAGATSKKLTVPPSSGMVQVNVDTENTRIVDCAAAEVVDDVCITPFRRRTAGDSSTTDFEGDFNFDSGPVHAAFGAQGGNALVAQPASHRLVQHVDAPQPEPEFETDATSVHRSEPPRPTFDGLGCYGSPDADGNWVDALTPAHVAADTFAKMMWRQNQKEAKEDFESALRQWRRDQAADEE
jgi:hypothetical protein